MYKVIIHVCTTVINEHKQPKVAKKRKQPKRQAPFAPPPTCVGSGVFLSTPESLRVHNVRRDAFGLARVVIVVTHHCNTQVVRITNTRQCNVQLPMLKARRR